MDQGEYRSPESEARRLARAKALQARLQADPEYLRLVVEGVQAKPLPALEAFRAGIRIGTYDARLTIGTLCMLQVSRAAVLDESAELSANDVAHVMLMVCDHWRDAAVSCADDPGYTTDEIKKVVKCIGPKVLMGTCLDDISTWFVAMVEATKHLTETTDDVMDAKLKRTKTQDPDWWAEVVDVFAHEYGWTDNYILWELPLVRVSKLADKMRIRTSDGKEGGGPSDSVQALMEKTEQLLTEEA